MKITLGRIFLILTLICIAIFVLSKIPFDWNAFCLPTIYEYQIINGTFELSDLPIQVTIGETIGFICGLIISVGIQAIIGYLGFVCVAFLWQVTEYEDNSR